MRRYILDPPFKDELMTSWIARNALLYGMKPTQLATLITKDVESWKSDLDVFLNEKRMSSILERTGLNETQIRRLPFYGSCEYFYNQTGKTNQVKWVMPIGIRQTGKKLFSLQYCPCCLAEDGDRPYFRKHWRLGFMTACPYHSVQLHDRCPKCHSPIDLKRLQKHEEEVLYHPLDIVHCSKCGFDLRETEFVPTSSDEYEINRINLLQSSLGYGHAGDLEFNYSNLYFEGIRRLLSFLVCSPKGEKLFMHLRQDLGLQQIYHRELIGRNVEPERLNINLRRTGLIMIYCLLQDWPEGFIKVCKATNTSTHLIKTPYLEFPFWVTDVLFFHIKQYKYFACDEEKSNIVDFFERRLKKKTNPQQIKKFMNYYFKTNDTSNS
ncbi:TniQ family protein [Thiomicrospira sp. S5]|uniref:TniQ family protein n=1 Tax=Thiomicrospira sp. S5 TaxID=1803865 RepID=UPI000F8A0BBA|nr:TniQ family protein [Thiomicrospira sp. S5]AZR82960.1 hypothetical protein AYJ59_12165 [Thiomicrospira sp. S5]